MQGLDLARHLLVRRRDAARDQALHGTAHEARGTTHGQTVRDRAGGESELRHGDAVVESRVQPQEHARRLGGLYEHAAHRIPELPRQTVGHPAGSPSDPARQVHVEGMVLIHGDALVRELTCHARAGHGVPGKQAQGVLVVHEVHRVVLLRRPATRRHGLRVVRAVLHHLHAPRAQQVLLPLLGVGGHVHRGLQSEGGGDDPDGQSQVAGGAHHHAVLGHEGAQRCPAERRRVLVRIRAGCRVRQEAVGHGQ